MPGLANQAHTGCSEGFGLLAALQFLLQCCRHHRLFDSPPESLLHCSCFCDNKGTIRHVNDLINMDVTAPVLAIRDDFDLCCQMHATVMESQQLCKFQFSRVKGHQDRKPPIDKDGNLLPLPWPAELNVACDRRAQDIASGKFCARSTDQPSPMFPATRAHLLINGEVITKKLRECLHGTSTTQDCHKHLCTKLEWSDLLCDSVQWSAVDIAM